ncbi:MAG TPA: hypothetical protein VFD78_04055 [Chitinophagaceae bacterium]|nr:hypothetical protein [Chitinophagaceae bacterium]
MDTETLTNHISKLGKHTFENACKIVLQDVFNLKAINVDGQNDGGTDFTGFTATGERINTAYQITTQKSDIKGKAYRDAKKTIEKLGVDKFYFLTTININEIDARKIEHKITEELGIQSICLGAKQIAGLILSEGLLNKFIDDSNYPLPKGTKTQLEYNEMALHSYTLLSADASKLKMGIYDDTILFILSDKKSMEQCDLIEETIQFLQLSHEKENELQRRIGALFGNSLIEKNEAGEIELSEQTKNDLHARKSIYEIELSSLAAAQVDMMRSDFEKDWSVADSKKVALWIANAYISDQINNLKDVKASIVSNPLFDLEENGQAKLKNFLKADKGFEINEVDTVIEKLLENASDHPLITKISRASIYLALEGANPISSAKALGASRWSEFNIMLEPSVAIPHICSQLHKGKVNKYFDKAKSAINRASELGATIYIPSFYINECAGHLLKARRYNEIELNEEELVHSNNAFVANYYALKAQGERLPPTFMDYLCTYSTAIKTERSDVKSWIRAIMTDLQSVLVRSGVEFIDTPFYNEGDCIEFEKEYMYQLEEFEIEKKSRLIKHDTYALQFTNDKIVNDLEHWIVMSYDKSMIAVAKNDHYKGWITNPIKFLDFTETSKPLSETKLVSLVHSVATFSERTLSAGARIIDRVITYASDKMQDWEFKQDMEQFKNEMIETINLDKTDYALEIDKKTDEFLKKHGVVQSEEDENVAVD